MSRFAMHIKEIIEEEKRICKEVMKKTKERLKTLTGLRMENETQGNKYWIKGEERKCRMCGLEFLLGYRTCDGKMRKNGGKR